MSQQVYSVDLFLGSSVPATSNRYGVLSAAESRFSRVVDVNSIRPLGNFASQAKIEGDVSSAVSFELWTSINGEDFVKYDDLYDAEGIGEYIRDHAMAVCTKFKVKATNNNPNDAVTVSLWIGVQ